MKYDLIIIGAGPAGYVAANRAGQLGMKTALVEKKDIGGMCLNWGCIPTKALIESAKFYDRVKSAKNLGIDGIDPALLSFNWGNAKKRAEKIVTKLTAGINFLLKKNGVEVIKGEARIVSAGSITVDNRLLETSHILIATGSYPAPLQTAVKADKLLQIEHLTRLESLPKRILLFGHGGNVLELAQLFRMVDSEVTIVSPVENIMPGVDNYLTQYLLKKIRGLGIKIFEKAAIELDAEGRLNLGRDVVEFDLMINCSWRKAIVPPSDVPIELTPDGFIKVDESLQTSVKGIYAAGDVNGLSYLAHAASAQGVFAINHIQGVEGHMDVKQFPINIYTVPEVAQIGLTEVEIRDKEIEYKIGEFPMSANGKALAEDAPEGLIKVLSEKKYGEVLGVQIIAANATDLIAEAAAFMSVEATVYDVARTVHAHPTVSEVFLEAGMDAADKPIHK